MAEAVSSERVALVHDFLLDLRGAERVFRKICDLYPQADVFTAVYDEEGTEGRFEDRNVHTTFLQKARPSSRTFRALLPLYPVAIESLDLSDYDLVLSSSSAWAHAVLPAEGAVHVSYCYNPFRYAWNDRERTLASRREPISRAALAGLFRRWRQWDWIAAQRVDHYLAISRTTKARINSYFGRDATVVHPPVETSRFHPGAVGDYHLVLSELMPHKHIEDAVRAFNRLGWPLVVVGDGPDRRRLRRLAGPTITFTGRVPDLEAARLVGSCRALVVTAAEEFGIAAVEAQAAGRPVISVRDGGALETVREGVTGAFWEGGPDDLAAVVAGFDDAAVDPRECVANARLFDEQVFARALPREVSAVRADTDERREAVRIARRQHQRTARRGFTELSR